MHPDTVSGPNLPCEDYSIIHSDLLLRFLNRSLAEVNTWHASNSCFQSLGSQMLLQSARHVCFKSLSGIWATD